MKAEDRTIVAEHATKGVLPDTNVLLLFLVGSFDKGFIREFKRTAMYTADDYEIIRRLLGGFQKIVITPHVLTEVSNFSMKITEPKLSRYLAVLVKTILQYKEHHVPKESILPSPLLPKLGVTDLSIMEAAREEGCLVLTDDWPATNALRKAGCHVLNFSNLRWGR
ncbi:MAG: PIN domain-containing protein [Phycisphaerae bacterium]